MVTLIATVLALAGLVLPLTQLLKTQLGIQGRAVLLLSMVLGTVLGALLAVGGLGELAALPHYPDWLAGGVIGLLAGLVASGGKDTITAIQKRGAEMAPIEPVPGSQVALPEYRPATIEDVLRQTGEWPAPAWADDAPLAGER